MDSTSEFGEATEQILNSHMWLKATILDGRDLNAGCYFLKTVITVLFLGYLKTYFTGFSYLPEIYFIDKISNCLL